MTFREWLAKAKDVFYPDEMEDVARAAWNMALEEAARWHESRADMARGFYAKAIRSMKDHGTIGDDDVT